MTFHCYAFMEYFLFEETLKEGNKPHATVFSFRVGSIPILLAYNYDSGRTKFIYISDAVGLSRHLEINVM